MQFEKIQRNRVYEEIVHRIEEMMLQRRLVPGDKLPSERELSSMFGVGRSAVRQALAVLNTKGLIEVRVGDGSYARATPNGLVVAPLANLLEQHRQQVVDPIEVRQLLEPQIARLSTERSTPENIQKLEQIILRQKEEIQENGHFSTASDAAFHLQIVANTGNMMLVNVLETAFKLLEESRRLTLSTISSVQTSYNGHLKIFNAIRSGDPDMAYQAMLNHLEDLSKIILASLEYSE